jgi:threonine synthase
MWRYLSSLPLKRPASIATLGEGNTALVPSLRLGSALGLKQLWFKLESQNPTGSFKDRFASLAVSLMREEGRTKILATSSGNTGSALAAYAARFGLDLELYVLENAPEEKLLQCLAFGARIFKVRNFGTSQQATDAVFRRLQDRARTQESTLLISAVCISPREMEGVKTIALEICQQLKSSPGHVFIPVGGGGLFVECYRGFAEAFEKMTVPKMPRLHAVQPDGCATVVGPMALGSRRAEPVTCTSQISGLQVASVLDAQDVMDQIVQTGGSGQMVSDASVFCWQRRLIREEGIYTEPAGATAVAGLAAAVEKGLIQPEEQVVCLVTGNGFKDLKSIEGIVGNEPIPLIEGEEI